MSDLTPEDPQPLSLPSTPPIEDAFLDLPTETVATPASNRVGRVVAGVAGGALLLGGGLFAATQLGSNGPETPEAAVQELLDAAENEDVLGALAALEPGERRALKAPMEEMFEELKRVEILDSSFELRAIAGIDLEFSDVTMRTVDVRDGLAQVFFTGGTVTSSVDGEALPVGDFLNDTLSEFEVDRTELDESSTESLADEEEFLAAVKTSDGWKVSIGYTAAELARVDAGAAPIDPATGIAPIGAPSPEEALEGLIRATLSFDLRSMVGRLSPDEMGALQEYASLYINDAERAFASASDYVTITLNDIDVRAVVDGDRARTTVHGVDVDLRFAPDTIRDEATEFGFRWADDCIALDIPADIRDEIVSELGEFGEMFGQDAEANLRGLIDGDEKCTADLESFSEGVTDSMNGALGLFGFGSVDDMPVFPTLRPIEMGITTTKIDGEWYVAPFGTSLDAWNAVLRSLDRETLDEIVDWGQEMAAVFEESFSSGFSYDSTATSDYGVGYPDEPEYESSDQYADYSLLDELLTALTGEDDDVLGCLYRDVFSYPDEDVIALIEALESGPFADNPDLPAAFRASLEECSATT